MTTKKHTILGGKVHVCQRENSPFWQCSSYLNGKNCRAPAKEKSLRLAEEFAEDWCLTLHEKLSGGEFMNERLFGFAANKFLLESEADTIEGRNPKCLTNHQNHDRLHQNPLFEEIGFV